MLTTALLLAANCVQDPANDLRDLINWRSDPAAARAEALQAKKPLLAVFRCEP